MTTSRKLLLRLRHTAERAYARAPVWVQSGLCSVEGFRIQRSRYPERFDHELRHAMQRMQWPREAVDAWRLDRLRAMLSHAGRNVPYWRDVFADVGFRPEKIASVDELARLPVLTKDIVVEQGDRMHARCLPPEREAGRPLRLSTSGSTGAGLEFIQSRSAALRWWATCWRFRALHGITRTTWSAQVTGRVIVPIDRRDGSPFRLNFAGRQLLLSGYHLSADTAEQYLHEIARRRIPWIHGYPSLVVILADAAASGRIRLPGLRWITLASENVTTGVRDRIRAGFGIEPREHYAQTEAVANASEDPDGVIRIDEDFSIVELAHDPALEDACHIYGTSLDNWHQPFIRYDTRDVARPGRDAGPWMAPGRALSAIDGRLEDYVELGSGALVGRTDHIFKGLSFVREAQIRQQVRGAVEIHVVPRDGAWDEARDDALRRETAQRLGHETAVKIIPTNGIARSPNGKLRLVVRKSA